mgnify:CR=1 FL=1
MKKLLSLSFCVLLAACGSDYQQKVNIVTDAPDELAVTPPNCPNWEEPAQSNSYNNHHTNFGCATVTNYGAQISNPRDMIKGRGSNADAERTRLFVNSYNSGAASDAPAPAASSAIEGATSTGE